MKPSVNSYLYAAEDHDWIQIEIRPEFNNATLRVDGTGYLSLSHLSKEQVVRIHQQASAALAAWPQQCEGYQCTRLSEPGCTIRDRESLEDLPACREHADEPPGVAA